MNTKQAKSDKRNQLPSIKVIQSTKNKVAIAVIGTEYTIQSFYDEAALEKLKTFKSKK